MYNPIGDVLRTPSADTMDPKNLLVHRKFYTGQDACPKGTLDPEWLTHTYIWTVWSKDRTVDTSGDPPQVTWRVWRDSPTLLVLFWNRKVDGKDEIPVSSHNAEAWLPPLNTEDGLSR